MVTMLNKMAEIEWESSKLEVPGNSPKLSSSAGVQIVIKNKHKVIEESFEFNFYAHCIFFFF